MNKSSLYISLLALVVSAAALGVSVQKTAAVATDGNAESVAAVLNNDPKIVINALQKYEQVQREEQAREAAKAFAANIEAINNDPNTPYIGNKDAKVVLVEFFDFSCGYCKRLAPAMEKVIEANPDIKIVFKPITFVAQISKYAAQAALAADKQGKFLPMYSAMLNSPAGLTEDSINAMAERAGLNMPKFYEDVKSSGVQNTINEVAALADKVQIHGVPALVLNGKQLQVIDYEGIQQEINNVK